ncbi:MAG: hypothetical protein AAFO06_10770 [Cyanobacteria bacterium J06597_16]
MVDLVIPATLKIWLGFLLVFFFLGYPVPFCILFGAIGGVAGGLSTAWWQIKSGGALTGKENSGSNDGGIPIPRGSEPIPFDRGEGKSRWDIPFLKPNKAKSRYIERNKRARDRRIR